MMLLLRFRPLPIQRLLLAVLICLTTGGPLCARPNIVILFADDLGYGELGCQGNSQIPTPHIDRLAERGIRFTHGYVAASYCSASRAGLMTGRYPARFGYDYNPIGAKNMQPGVGLPPDEKTIADRLLNHGYATSLIGKWHLGGTAAISRCGAASPSSLAFYMKAITLFRHPTRVSLPCFGVRLCRMVQRRAGL